jgi:histidyl-tRNA synthetase
VLEAIELGGDDNAHRRLTVLRAMDKLDRLGLAGVSELLKSGRKDESGDFTPGANLDDSQANAVLDLLAATKNSPKATLDEIEKIAGDNATANAGHKELLQIANLIVAAGYQDRVFISPSVVRGLEYYTGPVYEAELLFDVTNEKGETVQFGSVGGGGRYDGLVKRFTGQDVPATGFSIGVSRLMTALKNLGKLGQEDAVQPVLVTVMDGDTEALGKYQKMVQELRAAGIRAEMYQGNWKKFGNQLKYADRRGCPLAIIQGSDEREAGKVQIKDLIEGKRLSGEIEDNVTWRESRPAQVEIAETDIVSAVQRMLAEQAEDRTKGGS